MFHECLGVVNAVPGEQGVCLGCLGVVFYCLGVFWGLLEGVSVLSEVSGSAFYSNLIYINCALIKSLTFSKRRGGPRCLKYQNVPTSRSFWPIGNPWERFQSWDTRVYFIPVPDDHTVTSLGRLKIKETKCTRANIVQNSNSLSLNFQLQAAPCSALGHTILWGEIMIKDIYILETLVWRNCHENALDNLQRMFFLSSWYIGFGPCYCHPSIQAKYFKA